ncbi:hypothetical protein Elgi_06100 [Paenibacillus elgii]|nr:hypothetical protein Elgi_06100 [Paenibacillus elgii]
MDHPDQQARLSHRAFYEFALVSMDHISGCMISGAYFCKYRKHDALSGVFEAATGYSGTAIT